MDQSPSSSSQSSSSAAPSAKIFVGGISKELEEGALKEYFKKYGDVKDVVVVKDRATGNVKGYGFVEFVEAEAVERAVDQEGQHLIRDVLVEVKRARLRSSERRQHQSVCHQTFVQSTNNSNNVNSITSKKIFVGGLPSNITEDEFKSYFEKFGSVNDVVIMNDSETNRPRGFGFITFDSEVAAQNTMRKRFHELNKKVVEVKIAVPKDNHHSSGSSYNNMNNNFVPGWEGPNSYVNYSPWGYPPYGPPDYGFYYGYDSQLSPGYGFGPVGYEGGCTYDGYSAIGYGIPYSCPMFTWNEHAMMTIRQISVPCTDATIYPGCVNPGPGGYMRMANGGYHGAKWLGKGKFNQSGGHRHMKELVNTVSLELENLKVDDAE